MDDSLTTWVLLYLLIGLIAAAIYMLVRRPVDQPLPPPSPPVKASRALKANLGGYLIWITLIAAALHDPAGAEYAWSRMTPQQKTRVCHIADDPVIQSLVVTRYSSQFAHEHGFFHSSEMGPIREGCEREGREVWTP